MCVCDLCIGKFGTPIFSRSHGHIHTKFLLPFLPLCLSCTHTLMNNFSPPPPLSLSHLGQTILLHMKRSSTRVFGSGHPSQMDQSENLASIHTAGHGSHFYTLRVFLGFRWRTRGVCCTVSGVHIILYHLSPSASCVSMCVTKTFTYIYKVTQMACV